MLSAIIITKNEESNIEDCLKSLAFVNEIIVVDSGSNDKTLEICKKYNAKIFSLDWPGFGPQKQRALDLASKPWVLSIDADERITKELEREILKVVHSNELDGYYLPRLSHICGEPVRFCGWYPDYILRLFKKDKAKFTPDLVHEKVIVDGKTAKLKNHIIHLSYSSLDQLIEKYNQYTNLGAKELFNKNKSASLTKAIIRAVFAFIKLYVLKLGFLDGRVGFIVAISSAETAYYKYLKLLYLKK